MTSDKSLSYTDRLQKFGLTTVAKLHVADNIDPTATTTETFSHLVTDQVRCHKIVTDVAETTQIIGPALQFV